MTKLRIQSPINGQFCNLYTWIEETINENKDIRFPEISRDYHTAIERIQQMVDEKPEFLTKIRIIAECIGLSDVAFNHSWGDGIRAEIMNHVRKIWVYNPDNGSNLFENAEKYVNATIQEQRKIINKYEITEINV